MASIKKHSAFITIYGINNIGKSTHAKLLVDRLRQEGYKAIYLKYPIYDLEPTGPKINAILRSGKKQEITEAELQTLFMQNRQDYEQELKRLLDDGTIIVAEDYTQTGISWGTAKGLDEAWVENLNATLLKEDFTLLMVGERALKAREQGHIHENDDALVARVDEILRRRGREKGWHALQVQPTKEATAALIWEAVDNFLRK